MNKKIYSLVWNRALRQVVVASELATSHGTGSANGTARYSARELQLGVGVLMGLCAGPLWAHGSDRSEATSTASSLSSHYYSFAELNRAQPMSLPASSTCSGISGESAG